MKTPEVKVGQIWAYGGKGYKIESTDDCTYRGWNIKHYPVKDPKEKCYCAPEAFERATLIEDVP